MRKKGEEDIPLEARVSDIRHNRGIFVYCHASGGLLAYAVRKFLGRANYSLSQLPWVVTT